MFYFVLHICIRLYLVFTGVFLLGLIKQADDQETEDSVGEEGEEDGTESDLVRSNFSLTFSVNMLLLPVSESST